MKKKTRFILFMAVVMLFAFTQIAMADYTLQVYQNSYSSGQGGEFAITALSGQLDWVLPFYASTTKGQSNSPSFESFCLEEGEYFTSGNTYTAVISNAAVKGGTTTSDPISKGTAYLYYHFAKGDLSGYNYGAGRVTSAGDLQNAIWFLEGEGGVNNSFVDLVANNITGIYGSLANAESDNNGALPVYALNLYEGSALRQDQLVVTPIPAAVWLLGTGLVALIGIRRRKNS